MEDKNTPLVKKGGEDPNNLSPKEAFSTVEINPLNDNFDSNAYLASRMFPSTEANPFPPIISGRELNKRAYIPRYNGYNDMSKSFGANFDTLDEIRDKGYTITQDVIGTDFAQNLQADLQSDWRAFGNSIGRLVTGTASNLVTGVAGFLWELPEALVEGQLDFNNWIYDVQKEIDEWGEEAMPVHRRTDGLAFDPFDGEWWSNIIANFGPTMALMIAGTFTGGAAAAGTIRGSTSLLSKAAKALRATGNTKRAIQLEKQAARLARQGSKVNRQVGALAGSLTSRFMESGMEASHIYYDAFDKALNEGSSIKEAQNKAAKAAQIGFFTNMPLMALDYLQFNSIFKALGPSKSWKNSLGTLSFNMVSEGLEEGLQHGISKGSIDAENILEGFGNIIPEMGKAIEEGDRDFWDAVVQGAMGGGVFAAIGTPAAQNIIKKAQANFDQRLQQQLEDKARLETIIKNIDSKDNLKKEDYEFIQAIYHAHNYDHIPEVKQKLENLLNNEEALNEMFEAGETIEYAPGVNLTPKEFIQKRLELLENISSNIDSITDEFGIGELGNIILHDASMMELAKQKRDILREKLGEEEAAKQYNNLSDEGTRLMHVARKVKSLDESIDFFENMEKDSPLSQMFTKEQIDYRVKALKEERKELSNAYKELINNVKNDIKEGNTSLTEEQLKAEEEFIKNDDSRLQKLENAEKQLDEQLKLYSENRNLLSDPNYTLQNKEQRFKSLIENASSTEALELFIRRNEKRLEDDLANDDTAAMPNGVKITDDLEKLIKKRRKELSSIEERKRIKESEFVKAITELKNERGNLQKELKSLEEKSEKETEEIKKRKLELELRKKRISKNKELLKDLREKGMLSAEMEESLSDDEINEAQEVIESYFYEDKALYELYENLLIAKEHGTADQFYERLDKILELHKKYKEVRFKLLTSIPGEYSEAELDGMRWHLKKIADVNNKAVTVFSEYEGFTKEEFEQLKKENPIYSQARQMQISDSSISINPVTGILRWNGKNYYHINDNYEDSFVFNEDGSLRAFIAIDEDFNLVNLVNQDISNTYTTSENAQIIEVNKDLIREIYETYVLTDINDLQNAEAGSLNELRETFVRPQKIKKHFSKFNAYVGELSNKSSQLSIKLRRIETVELFEELKAEYAKQYKELEDLTKTYNDQIELIKRSLSNYLGSEEDLYNFLKQSPKYKIVLEAFDKADKLYEKINTQKKQLRINFNRRAEQIKEKLLKDGYTEQEIRSIIQRAPRRSSTSSIEAARSTATRILEESEEQDEKGSDSGDGSTGTNEGDEEVSYTGLSLGDDSQESVDNALLILSRDVDNEGNLSQEVIDKLTEYELEFFEDYKDIILDIKKNGLRREGKINLDDPDIDETGDSALGGNTNEEEDPSLNDPVDDSSKEEGKDSSEKDPIKDTKDEPINTNKPTESNQTLDDFLAPAYEAIKSYIASLGEDYGSRPYYSLALNNLLSLAYRDYRSNFNFTSNIVDSILLELKSQKDPNKEDIKLLEDLRERSEIATRRLAVLLNTPHISDKIRGKNVEINVDLELLEMMAKHSNLPDTIKSLFLFVKESIENGSEIHYQSFYGKVKELKATEDEVQYVIGNIPMKSTFEHEGETYEAYLHTSDYFTSERQTEEEDVVPQYHPKYIYDEQGERVGVQGERIGILGESGGSQVFSVDAKGSYSAQKLNEYVTERSKMMNRFRINLIGYLSSNKKVTTKIETQSPGHLNFVTRTNNPDVSDTITFDEVLANTDQSKLKGNIEKIEDIQIAVYLGDQKYKGIDEETIEIANENQIEGLPLVLVPTPITNEYITVPVHTRTINKTESELIIDATLHRINRTSKNDFNKDVENKYGVSNLNASEVIDVLIYQRYLKDGEQPDPKDINKSYFAIERPKEGKSGKIHFGSNTIEINENGISKSDRNILSEWLQLNMNRRIHSKGLTGNVGDLFGKSFQLLGEYFEKSDHYNKFLMQGRDPAIKSFLTSLETNQSNIVVSNSFEVSQSGQDSSDTIVSTKTPPSDISSKGDVFDKPVQNNFDFEFMEAQYGESVQKISNSELEEQRKWWKENLPQIPLEIVDRLISISNNKVAFGAFISGINALDGSYHYKAVASTMQSKSRPGTIYHEAIHPVFRLLLTEAEQKEILNALEKEFGTPTQEQLDLMEGVNTKEDWLEEKLAEKHRLHKLRQERTGKKESKTLMQRFFNWINSIIDSFRNNKSIIDRFFEDLNNGKFSDRVVLTDRIKLHSTSYMEAKKLPINLSLYNDYNDIQLAILFNSMDLSKFDGSTINLLDQAGESVEERKRYYINNLQKIIDKAEREFLPRYSDNNDALNVLKNRIDTIKSLISFIDNSFETYEENLQRYLVDKFDLKEIQIDREEKYSDEEISGEVVRKQSYEIHYKQKASDLVKLLIGLNFGNRYNNRTLFFDVIDDSSIYNFLIKRLADIQPSRNSDKSTFDLYLEEIEKEVMYRPELQNLHTSLVQLSRNENASHVIRQFVNAFRNTNKNFVTGFIKNENGEVITDINISSTNQGYKKLIEEFHESFQNSSAVAVNRKTGKVTVQHNYLDRMIKIYEDAIEIVTNIERRKDRHNREGYIKALKVIHDALLPFGMNISGQALNYTVDERLGILGEPSQGSRTYKRKIRALNKMAQSLGWMISNSSVKGSFKNIADTFRTLSAIPLNQRTKENFDNIYDSMVEMGSIITPFRSESGNFADLTENELSFRYDLSDHSKIGGEGARYYEYANPTALDRMVHEINSGNESVMSEEVTDPGIYAENSLILGERRANNRKIQVHTLNTIVKRDVRDIGDKAAKIDMTDELSFFMNAALMGRIGYTSLYRLPSFSDKSTAHKMLSGFGVQKGKSNTSIIEPYSLFNSQDGKLKVNDSVEEILSRYFADELNRLKTFASDELYFEKEMRSMYSSQVFPEVPLYKLLENPSEHREFIHDSLLQKNKKVLNKKGKKILAQLKAEYEEKLKSIEKETLSIGKYNDFKTDLPNIKGDTTYFSYFKALGNKLFDDLFNNKGDQIFQTIVDGKVDHEAIKRSFSRGVHINAKMRRMTFQAMLTLQDLGLIDRVEKGKDYEYKLNTIDPRIRQYYIDKFYGSEATNIDESIITKAIVGDYVYNSFLVQMESLKLFIGDPAFYKTLMNLTKRTPAILTDGLYAEQNDDVFGVAVIDESVTEKASEYITVDSSQEKGLTDAFSVYFDMLGFETKGHVKSLVSKIKNGYTKKMDPTDAQAYITFERFIKIMKDLGRKPIPNEIIERIKKGEETNRDREILLNEIDWFSTQPLKGVYFSQKRYKLKNGRTVKIPTYHKYSQAVLFPSLVKGNPVLENMYNSMQESSTDELMFTSAYKVGAYKLSEINSDNIFDLRPIELRAADWKMQQDLPPNKYRKLRRINNGSQKEKNIVSNIIHDADYSSGETITIDGIEKESITGRELISEIFKTVKTLSNKALSSLKKQLDIKDDGTFNPELLFNKIKDDLANRGVPFNYQNVMESMEHLDELIAYRHDMSYSFSSMINKASVKLTEPGGAFIQMSGFGISRDVKAYSELSEEERGRITVIDELKPTVVEEDRVEVGTIFLPHTVQELIERVSKKSIKELSPEEIKNYLADGVLGAIGYRIPNQGITSIEYLNIGGFLPMEMGDTVIVNDETTSKYGSDFDIDKLYIFMPNLYIDKGKIKRVPFLDNTDLETHYRFRKRRIQNRIEGLNEILFRRKYNNSLSPEIIEEIELEIQELQDQLVEDFTKFKEENEGKDVYDLNTKEQVENRKFELYETILKDPKTAAMSMIPLDQTANWLKEDIKDLHGETQYRNSEVFWTDIGQLEVKNQNIKAKFMIAVGANNEVNHVLNQIHNVVIEIPGFENRSYENILDEDGNFILHNIDAFLNAFVDAAKDPFILNGNINDYTFNEAMILFKQGISRKKILAFIGQPILKQVSEAFFAQSGKFKQVTKGYDNSDPIDIVLRYKGKNRYKVFKNAYRNYKSMDISELWDIIEQMYDEGILASAIKERSENPRAFETNFGLNENQTGIILALFSKLKSIKDLDVNEMLASKVDVNGMPGGMDAVIAQEEQVRKALNISRSDYSSHFIPLLKGNLNEQEYHNAIEVLERGSSEGMLKNFYKKFYDPDFGGLTSIGQYYVNSIIEPQEIFKDTRIDFSDKMKEIVYEINQDLGRPYANDVNLNKLIIDNVYAYLFSDMPMFKKIDFNGLKRMFFNTGEKSNSLALRMKRLLKSKVSIVEKDGKNRVIAEKAPLDGFKVGKYFKSYSNKSYTTPQHIYTDNFVLKSAANKETVISEIESFISGLDNGYGMSNSERVQVKRVFKLLPAYAYFTSGFIHGKTSIFDLMPPHVYNEIRHHVATEIKSFINSDAAIDELKDQMVQNNWYNNKFVPQIINDRKSTNIDSGSINLGEIKGSFIYYTIKDTTSVITGKGPMGENVYSRYLNIVSYDKYGRKYNKLVRLIGVDQETGTPHYVQIKKKGYYNKGRKIIEYRKGEGSFESIIDENNEGIDFNKESIIISEIINKLGLVDNRFSIAFNDITAEELSNLKQKAEEDDTSDSFDQATINTTPSKSLQTLKDSFDELKDKGVFEGFDINKPEDLENLSEQDLGKLIEKAC